VSLPVPGVLIVAAVGQKRQWSIAGRRVGPYLETIPFLAVPLRVLMI